MQYGCIRYVCAATAQKGKTELQDAKGFEYKEGWNEPDRQTVEIYDYRIPEVEDCSNGLVPDNLYVPDNPAGKEPITGNGTADGEKEVLVADTISFTKYFFSHYKGALYLELCKWVRNGRLSKLVGFPVLNRSINKADCTFPDVAYWRIDRENFYADIAVDMNLQTPTGTRQWKGYLILWCSFEEEFSYTVEDMNPWGHTEKDGYDRLSSYLVPIYTNKRMDEISEEMLKKHLPGALTDPSKRDAVKMAESMGLTVLYFPLYDEDTAESVLFFERKWVRVGDPDEQGEEEWEEIPANTIVINLRVIPRAYSGFSIFHECIHFEHHYMFYRLQGMGNNNPRHMKTHKVKAGKKNTDPVYFMEKQANRGANGLMMPASDTRRRITSLRCKIRCYKHEGKLYEKVGLSLAAELSVAQFRIRMRMMQLGYIEAHGALNYVDRKLIRPFAFNVNALESSEKTFVVRSSEVTKLYHNNDHFRSIMDDGRFVYADGHVAVNDPRFVYQDKRTGEYYLTDEAEKHADTCCLRFDRIYTQEGIGRYIHGVMFYDPHYVEKCKVYLSKYQDKTLSEGIYAYQEAFSTDFEKEFSELLEVNNETRESLAVYLGIDRRTLYRWIKDPQNCISQDFVVLISQKWQLPDFITEAILDRLDKSLNRKNPRHRALLYIRSVLWDQGVDAANEYLKECKCAQLTISKDTRK